MHRGFVTHQHKFGGHCIAHMSGYLYKYKAGDVLTKIPLQMGERL